MKRRIISVPIDRDAQIALDLDKAMQDQLIELYLVEDVFNSLYETGVFRLINDVGNINIDDFEDESITDIKQIKNVIDALLLREKTCGKEVFPKLLEIRRLFEEALKRETGVYFYF